MAGEPPQRDPDEDPAFLSAIRKRGRSWSQQWRVLRRAEEEQLADATSRHVIVCGDDPLAHRLIDELVKRYPVRVTAIIKDRHRNHGPRISAIEGIEVIEADAVDAATLTAAGVTTADALAIMYQDDVGNIHAALLAQDLNPRVRLVIRMFNMHLGRGVRAMFSDCMVLSDAAIAAPAFVAATLGEVTPTHIRLPGRTLFVARRSDVQPGQVVCGLATTGGDEPVLLPDDDAKANIVLATAATPAGAADPMMQRRWRRRAGRIVRSPLSAVAMLKVLAARRLWRLSLVLLGLLLVGSALHALKDDLSLWRVVDTTILMALGGGNDPDFNQPLYLQIAQLVVVVAGVALIPTVTAAVVETVVTTPWDALATLSYSRHVVVIGLGNVGTRVIQQLHDLGLQVVAIDKHEDARGVAIAQELNIPLIIGDASRESTLRQANLGAARAVVALSTDDVINLEAALHARRANPGIRTVLRLFDGDFAELVQNAYGSIVSRSVSYVAAPAFAAALLEREVVGTIPVERRVLLVAEVPVAAQARLAGQAVGQVKQHQEVRVLALTPGGATIGAPETVWTPPDHHRLDPGDRLLVITTRAGLGNILTDASPPMSGGDDSAGGQTPGSVLA
ncbi:NAD-binding protein [Luedemannella flava]|uniref:NAD-binding protein n=1 Tax=Luedemannella flava TaxID=349316 RepID=A0ABP4Y314_9ACTN